MVLIRDNVSCVQAKRFISSLEKLWFIREWHNAAKCLEMIYLYLCAKSFKSLFLIKADNPKWEPWSPGSLWLNSFLNLCMTQIFYKFTILRLLPVLFIILSPTINCITCHRRLIGVLLRSIQLQVIVQVQVR